jgi:carbonic anhydrase
VKELKVLEGNKNYVEGKPKPKDLNAKRKETIAGQKPFATVLACSDSRVVPEYIFDTNIGEIFVIRVAGNVVDNCVLGSIEYAVEHLHTPILVVLGHEKCGAITAACKGLCENNNIDYIIEKIKPAICKVGSDNIEYTIEENIRCVKEYITLSSEVVRKKIKEGKLMIVGMKYSLSTGEVNLIND